MFAGANGIGEVEVGKEISPAMSRFHGLIVILGEVGLVDLLDMSYLAREYGVSVRVIPSLGRELSLLDDPSERQRLGERARDSAKQYDSQRLVR